VLGATLTLALAGSGPAFAQAAPSTGLPNLNRQVPPVSPPPTGVAKPSPGGACPFANRGLSVTLSEVKLQGATKVSSAEARAAVADLLGSPHDLGVVCQVRDRIAALYDRKGYRLTRVDVPPQRISGGVLTLTATEGYVSHLDLDGLAPLGPSAALARAYFAPLLTERPTQWADLERAVLLARAIPGADISVRVHAGEPGAVEVAAIAQPRSKFDLSLGVQDLGSSELGTTAIFGRLDANSFTRFADRTSIVLFSTTTGDQKVVEGVEGVNLGSQGLRAEAEVDYAYSTPKGALAPLDIKGDFLDASLRLDYPLVRSQSFDALIGGRFDYINEKNDIGIFDGFGGAPPLFEDRLRLFSADVGLGWRPSVIPQLEAQANGSIVQGINGLGASRRGDPFLSRAQGDPAATVLRANVALRWTYQDRRRFPVLGGPWAEARISAQWANHPLLAYEQFQIGNYTVGRGFDPGAASGDRAVGGQFDVGWRFPAPWGALSGGRHAALLHEGWVEPYGFVDAARLTNLSLGSYDASIVSVGGGVRALLPWDLRLDVAYAAPLTAAFPGAGPSQGRVLVTLDRVFRFR
jgi:hemolysin activation/secretion protein